MRTPHTALVLDIDGVVCPASGSSPFGDLVAVGVALEPVRVPPALCAALADLAARPHVTPAWLTSWLPGVRRAMRPPFPGRDWEQIDLSPAGDDAGAWPKWPALTRWLARHPSITRVAWVDDDLGQHARSYAGELGRRGIDALLLAPAADCGMTSGDVARLREWLGLAEQTLNM